MPEKECKSLMHETQHRTEGGDKYLSMTEQPRREDTVYPQGIPGCVLPGAVGRGGQEDPCFPQEPEIGAVHIMSQAKRTVNPVGLRTVWDAGGSWQGSKPGSEPLLLFLKDTSSHSRFPWPRMLRDVRAPQGSLSPARNRHRKQSVAGSG